MVVKLFSTNCPRCKVLETKLKQNDIKYEVETDINTMLGLGIKSAPCLLTEDGELLEFTAALRWLKEIQQ